MKGIDGVETKVQFKNFPLSIHQNAELAHEAAMAAREQGKFWEMHDLLFANQSAVRREDLLRYARQLKLDVNRFRKDMDADRIKQSIRSDVAEGEKLGVNATPTFFIDGRAYVGSKSFDQLKELILGTRRRIQALADIPDVLMSKGPAEAPVTLELFLDLQSPLSRPAIEVVQQLMMEYPSTLRLQLRNFPLAFHLQAPLAHEAAVTAAREGRFWEFVAYSLDHQGSLNQQDLIRYAGQLGMDESKFTEAIQEHRYAARVNADVETGVNRGIRGSPVIFVNTKRIDGVPNLETLKKYVDGERP